MRKKVWYEKIVEGSFVCFASFSILGVIFITFFIFMSGYSLFTKIDFFRDFLFSTNWAPTDKPAGFGILAFIIGSFAVTAGALLLAVPIGLGVGIFMAEMVKGRTARLLHSGVEVLAGIPSIIYGLFGVFYIAPVIRALSGSPTGLGVLNAAIILAIMILPTIISLTDVSLRAVGREIREGSLALGATHWQTIINALVPAARSGIIAGIVLGTGRAVGETVAVLMVAGNSPVVPVSLLSHIRTLTMNIITDMKYAAVGSDHETSLFSTGIMLFIFILGINIVVQLGLKKRINGGNKK